MISIVRGNDFKLTIPVEIKGMDNNGNIVYYPFDFEGSEGVIVTLKDAYGTYQFPFITQANIIQVDVDGTKIKDGIYSLEIRVLKDGNYRSFKKSQLKIVDCNDDSNIISSAEFETEVYQLEAQAMVSFGSRINIVEKLPESGIPGEFYAVFE